MDQKSVAYFSSINPLARKIIQDEQTLRGMVGGEWENLDCQKQEELLDNYLVDMAVREQYANVEKQHSYPPSFPSLKVESGEKIVVDFENDCWTWQDEHSSPFSWKTKSQQNLTLLDFEPDQLGKLPTKSAKKEPEAEVEQQPDLNDHIVAPREFSVQSGGSIWESPFLAGMKKPEYLNRSHSSSPAKSITNSKESIASRERTPEEVNYAFTASCDDLSSSGPSTLDNTDSRSPSVSSTEVLGSSPGKNTDQASKSSRRRRSLRNSPLRNVLAKKDMENGHTSLMKSDASEENAFDNPGLGSEETSQWSRFVNDSGQDSMDSSSANASPSRQLLREPEPVQIDRGDSQEGYTDGLLADHEQEQDFQEEELFVTNNMDVNPLDETEDMESSLPRTGFGFLDDW